MLRYGFAPHIFLKYTHLISTQSLLVACLPCCHLIIDHLALLSVMSQFLSVCFPPDFHGWELPRCFVHFMSARAVQLIPFQASYVTFAIWIAMGFLPTVTMDAPYLKQCRVSAGKLAPKELNHCPVWYSGISTRMCAVHQCQSILGVQTMSRISNGSWTRTNK